jgi:DNA-binding transcriptional MerR regulator
MMTEGWSGAKTAEIVGITYRQLDYWARTDLIRPSLADAKGSGTRRRYSYSNLLELKVIKRLLDAGIRLEQVREVFDYLRQQVGDAVASANLVIDGHAVLLARDDGELIDLVRKGQGVLNILSLANVKDEVDSQLSDIGVRPASADDSHVAAR